jgi:hypothetical protein
MNKIGKISFDKVVLDCKDPVALSDFYVSLLGWTKGYITDDFVIIASEDCNVDIGFQRNEMYVAPVWPEEENKQQQMLHIDFSMQQSKLQEWIDYAVSIGAKKSQIQFPEHGDGVVMFDPEGHPFCLDVIYDM